MRGYGTLQTGVAFLPQTLVLAVLSLGPTAWLVTRFGPRVPLIAGLSFAAIGLAVLTGAGVQTSYFPTVMVAFLLMGLGAGMAFMPLLTIAMADVPAQDAGLASGIVNASLQLSAALGVAVLGTIATDHTQTLVAHGTAPINALLSGYHLAFVVATGCVAAAVIATLILLRGPSGPKPVPEVAVQEAA